MALRETRAKQRANAGEFCSADAILRSIQDPADNVAGLCSQLKVYLAPLAVVASRNGPRDKENRHQAEEHSLVKQHLPFLVQLLKICSALLTASQGSDVQKKADELFSAMALALDSLQQLRAWLAGCSHEIEIQRYRLVRLLITWKRHREALAQCWEVYRSLCSTVLAEDGVAAPPQSEPSGKGKQRKVKASEMVEDLHLPLPHVEQELSSLAMLVTGVATDLVFCAAEDVSTSTSMLRMLASLPEHLDPWFRVLPPASAEKQNDIMFKRLYRLASLLAEDPLCYEAEIVHRLCVVALDRCANSSQYGQYVKVARKLCFSLSIHAPKLAVSVCKASLSTIWQTEQLTLLSKSSEMYPEELRWLMSSTYNMGVQIFNAAKYELACDPLRLAYEVACARMEVGLVGNAGALESTNVEISKIVSDVIAKGVALVDALIRSGNHTAAVEVLLDGLYRWGRAHPVAVNLQSPRSLVRLWVKTINAAPTKETPCLLFDALRKIQPPLSSCTFGQLMQEELSAYDALGDELSKMKKGQILDLLLNKVYIGGCDYYERSRVLLEKARMARFGGTESLMKSMAYLSQAVTILEHALQIEQTDQKPDQKKNLLHQSAITLCVRALCGYEEDPSTKHFIEDFSKCLECWREVLHLLHEPSSRQVPIKELFGCTLPAASEAFIRQEAIGLLLDVGDLAALKGYSELQDDIQELILDFSAAHGDASAQELFTSLWARRQLGHVLCHVPHSPRFSASLSRRFGMEADSLEAWATYAKTSSSFLLDARVRLIAGDLLGKGSSASDNIMDQAVRAEASDASGPSSKGQKTAQALLDVAGVYHALSQRALESGDLVKAVTDSKEALQLRFKCFSCTFQPSKKALTDTLDRIDPRSLAAIVCSKQLDASGHVGSCAWPTMYPREGLDPVPSQWRVIGDYLESLFQVGVVQERSGVVDEAEKNFLEGLRIANALHLPISQARFTSALGEIFRKQHLWKLAVDHFTRAQEVYSECDINLSCKSCIQAGRGLLRVRVGDLIRRCSDESVLPAFADRLMARLGREMATSLNSLDQALQTYCSVNEEVHYLFGSSICSGDLGQDFDNQAPCPALNDYCNAEGPRTMSHNVASTSHDTQECSFSHGQREFLKTSSMHSWAAIKWAQCGRHLMARALTQKGKTYCKLGLYDSAEQSFRRSWTLLQWPGPRNVLHSFESLSLDQTQIIPDISQTSLFPLDEAWLLYHISKLRLQRDLTKEESRIDPKTLQQLLKWLYRSFQLCHQVPHLLQKVANLLALLHVPISSGGVCQHPGKSLEDLHTVAAYFHQAALGAPARQQHLAVVNSKLAALVAYPDKGQNLSQRKECLEDMKQALRIVPNEVNGVAACMETLVKCLAGSTACCVGVVDNEHAFLLKQEDNSSNVWLFITHMGSQAEPVVMVLPVIALTTEICSPYSLGNEDGGKLDKGIQKVMFLDSVIPEFASIMKESRTSTAGTEPVTTIEQKSAWWKWRTDLDFRLSSLLSVLEDLWLGPWKCFFLGRPSDTAVARALEKSAKKLRKRMQSIGQRNEEEKFTTEVDEKLVHLLLQGLSSLKKDQLEAGIAWILGWKRAKRKEASAPADSACGCVRSDRVSGRRQQVISALAEEFVSAYKVCTELNGLGSRIRVKTTRRAAKQLELQESSRASFSKDGISGYQILSRLPLQLVLDGNLQVLPWESLPCVRECEMYRMPSMGSIRALIVHQNYAGGLIGSGMGTNSRSVNASDAFYLLNPSGDLASTQAAFQDWFAHQEGWKGKAGEVPSVGEFLEGLLEHDLFIYFGHGSGEQYFPERRVRRLDNCAAALLMGCGSGRLAGRGDYDPVGVPLSYLMAGCPTAICNLWDVTDGDIDRFSRVLLHSWIGSCDGSGIKHEEGTEGATSRNDNPISSRLRQRTKRSTADEGDAPTVPSRSATSSLHMGSVTEGRKACKLPFLIGAAPICYGVPTPIVVKH